MIFAADVQGEVLAFLDDAQSPQKVTDFIMGLSNSEDYRITATCCLIQVRSSYYQVALIDAQVVSARWQQSETVSGEKSNKQLKVISCRLPPTTKLQNVLPNVFKDQKIYAAFVKFFSVYKKELEVKFSQRDELEVAIEREAKIIKWAKMKRDQDLISTRANKQSNFMVKYDIEPKSNGLYI